MRAWIGGVVATAVLTLAPAVQAATTAEYGGGSTLRSDWGGRDTNVGLRVLDDGTFRYSVAVDGAPNRVPMRQLLIRRF